MLKIRFHKINKIAGTIGLLTLSLSAINSSALNPYGWNSVWANDPTPSQPSLSSNEGTHPQQDLENLQQQIDRSDEERKKLSAELHGLIAEIQDIKIKLVKESNDNRALEQEIVQHQQNIELTHFKIDEIQNMLQTQIQHAQNNLMALQKLSLQPPFAVFFQPQSLQTSITSALYIDHIRQQIKRDMDQVKTALDEMKIMHESLLDEKEKLEDTQKERKKKLEELESLLVARQDKEKILASRRNTLDHHITELQYKAKNLEQLIKQWENNQIKKPASSGYFHGDAASLPGLSQGDPETMLMPPVAGTLVSRQLAKQAQAKSSKGLFFRAEPGHRVVAPAYGQVIFSGPFRGYGQIFIIDHGQGYYTILSGFKQDSILTGALVNQGEPVGVVEAESPDSDGLVYIELRHNNIPIDPQPWLGKHGAE